MNWTCRHCEYWSTEGCLIFRDPWPNGSPETCEDFYREPGADDEIGDDDD